MGSRWNHHRHGWMRSLRLQQVVAGPRAEVESTPQDVQPPSEAGPMQPAPHSVAAFRGGGQFAAPVFIGSPAVPTQVAVAWSPSRLADPLVSARRVNRQLQQSGGVAARTHAALAGVHELLGVD
ncbi:MAG: hypothetical protein VX127_04075 [Myxococcota bacterium]|nr:hypothetical protein [Myxococcota bacterium]